VSSGSSSIYYSLSRSSLIVIVTVGDEGGDDDLACSSTYRDKGFERVCKGDGTIAVSQTTEKTKFSESTEVPLSQLAVTQQLTLTARNIPSITVAREQLSPVYTP